MSTMYVNQIAPLQGDTVTIDANSKLIHSGGVQAFVPAYANFGTLFDDTTTVTISNASAYGITWDFHREFSPSKNIIINPSTNTFKFAYTGIYAMHIMYRQASGGDLWAIYAVTKNGNSNAVGYSARVGSTDSEEKCFSLIYKVDDTSATYQIQGWCQTASRVAGVSGGYDGNPSWTDGWGLNTLGSNKGRTIDIFTFKVSDL